MFGGIRSLFGVGGVGGGRGRSEIVGAFKTLDKGVQWMASKMFQFSMFLAGVLAPLYAFHKAIQFLSKGMEKLGETYQMSARVARPASENVALKAAFAAAGLGGGEYEYQTAQQQFNPRARISTLPSSGEVIAAMRPAQYGNIQQLTNMAKQFDEAMKRAEDSARQMEASSAAGQRLALNGVIIGLKWNAMLEQLAETMSPVISLFQSLAEKLLGMVNESLEIWNFFHKNKVDLIKPGQERTLGMKGSGGHGGTWEKMGFSFPNPANNVQQTIANNTGVIASAVKKIQDVLIENFKAQMNNPWNQLKSLNPFTNNP
jgi:hypothetical protein